MTDPVYTWLLESDEPWTRYRTLVDLLERPNTDADVQAARAEMLAHPQVRALIAETATWPGYPLKRHNDAKHPIHKLSLLADFGLRASDPGMKASLDAVMAHQSAEGAFQTVVNIPQAFGGTGQEQWSWMLCDAPTLLYSVLSMAPANDQRAQRAVAHLVSRASENGWHCLAATELGRFRGPGRQGDPCPIANVYALKALSLLPDQVDSPATRAGTRMLLEHWHNQNAQQIYLFGIGTDFRKLKLPFVWYDILHVTEVLSRFPFVHGDPRLDQMVDTITSQAGD